MEMNDYQELARRTAIYPAEHGLMYTVLGLTNESGELAGKLKKMYRDDNGILTTERRDSLIDELGDVLWYAAMVARELDVALADVACINIGKLESRRIKNTLKGDGDDR